jgi:hypothetical protein
MIQVKLTNEMIEDVMMQVFPGQNICFFIEAVALNEIKKTFLDAREILEQKNLFNYNLCAKVIHIESEFDGLNTNTAVVETQKHYFFLRYDPGKIDIQKNDYLFFEAAFIINSYDFGSAFYSDEDIKNTISDSYSGKKYRLARLCQMYKVLAVHRYLYVEEENDYLIESVKESGLISPDDLSDFILTVKNSYLSAGECQDSCRIIRQRHLENSLPEWDSIQPGQSAANFLLGLTSVLDGGL